MAQQTAVEYLLEKLYTEYRFAFSGTIVDKAKHMDKEQIVDAYGDGQENGIECQKKLSNGYDCNVITSIQYYNETYNK